jgi:hypothetical protein
VRPWEPLASLGRLRVDLEREPRVLVADLARRVVDVVAAGAAEARIRASERVEADRADCGDPVGKTLAAASQWEYSDALRLAQAKLATEEGEAEPVAATAIPLKLSETPAGREAIDARVAGEGPERRRRRRQGKARRIRSGEQCCHADGGGGREDRLDDSPRDGGRPRDARSSRKQSAGTSRDRGRTPGVPSLGKIPRLAVPLRPGQADVNNSKNSRAGACCRGWTTSRRVRDMLETGGSPRQPDGR